MKRIFAILHITLSLSFFIDSFAQTAPRMPTAEPRRNPADTTGYKPIPFFKQAGADLELIRTRMIQDLLEPAVNNSLIAALIKTIKLDGSWPGINYQDVSRTGFQHSRHLENMLELSRAYKKPGSSYYHNEAVKQTVSAALDFWIAHDFICENWWWNEMGTPNLMINTLLVLDTDLTEKQRVEGARIANRANLEASGARPGGDLIQIAGMFGKQGLFAKNEAVLERVVKVMADEIKITSEQRGMQPDLSFHHRVDNVISTLTYGTGYANAFAYWAVKIAGTRYKLPEQSMKLLIDYYLDGICKSLIYATYPDPAAMNRDLSRRGALEAMNARIPENLLLASNYRKDELQQVVDIRNGKIKPTLTSDKFFWHSSYFSHQRPDYFASVRIHSSRNFNMEQPHNEEGLKNHHFADGSNFISISGREYFDIFPVWDWQKIPGTTIVQKPALPRFQDIPKKGLTDFSGGASDGKYGVVAFDFSSPHDQLKAKKSWFFFDQEYVCLGAGIESKDTYPVFTTLNQCLLDGDVMINSNGKTSKVKKGSQLEAAPGWVYHDSVAYVFPYPRKISLSTTTATGNWRSINHQAWATEEPVSRDVFSLWINHGVLPVDSGYMYIVVPAIKPTAVDAYTKKHFIHLVSNTPALQAVRQGALNITGAVFYQPGKVQVLSGLYVEVDQPAILIVKTDGKKIKEITVTDPTQKLKNIRLTINAALKGTGKDWKLTNGKSSVVEVDLPQQGYAGQPVTMHFD